MQGNNRIITAHETSSGCLPIHRFKKSTEAYDRGRQLYYSRGSSMTGKVFGVDLDTLVKQQQVEIPKLVTHALEYLRAKKAHLEEGLFRIPGNNLKIQELRKIIDRDGTVDFNAMDVDSHTVGGLLKMYLRELPVSLIIPRFYSTFLKVYTNPDPKQRLVNMKILVMGLPKSNRSLLLAVLHFLHLVADHHTVNKMSSLNLALIFSPNIMRSQVETLTSIMEDSDKVSRTLQLLIHEVDYLETGQEPQWFQTQPTPIPKAEKPASLRHSTSASDLMKGTQTGSPPAPTIPLSASLQTPSHISSFSTSPDDNDESFLDESPSASSEDLTPQPLSPNMPAPTAPIDIRPLTQEDIEYSNISPESTLPTTALPDNIFASDKHNFESNEEIKLEEPPVQEREIPFAEISPAVTPRTNHIRKGTLGVDELSHPQETQNNVHEPEGGVDSNSNSIEDVSAIVDKEHTEFTINNNSEEQSDNTTDVNDAQGNLSNLVEEDASTPPPNNSSQDPTSLSDPLPQTDLIESLKGEGVGRRRSESDSPEIHSHTKNAKEERPGHTRHRSNTNTFIHMSLKKIGQIPSSFRRSTFSRVSSEATLAYSSSSNEDVMEMIAKAKQAPGLTDHKETKHEGKHDTKHDSKQEAKHDLKHFVAPRKDSKGTPKLDLKHNNGKHDTNVATNG